MALINISAWLNSNINMAAASCGEGVMAMAAANENWRGEYRKWRRKLA